MYSSHSNLITQSRVFKNMKDNDFEEFLTNDLVPVTTNYFMNASKTIEHKLHFLGAGKNIKVLNRGEERITLKPGYEKIGTLQARKVESWIRETPSSSMRVAQYKLDYMKGNGQLVVFSGSKLLLYPVFGALARVEDPNGVPME